MGPSWPAGARGSGRDAGDGAMDRERSNLGLAQILAVLRRRALVIVLLTVLACGSAYGFSKRETRQYTATASLVFSNDQLSQQVAGLSVASSNNQQAQQNTDLKLVQIGDMATKTAARLGRGLTEEEVGASVSVSAPGESNIVEVSATNPSPVLAAAIANTYGAQFVSEQQNANHAYYSSALALVNRQLAALTPSQRLGTAALALEDRAQSLGVLAELRSGNVQIARIAKVPTAPSSPKVIRNTVLGAILGLLLGLGLAFLLERLDRRIREPRDLEAVYGLPLLGVVPESAALASRPKRGGHPRAAPTSSEVEVFHLIRAHLRYFNVDRELRTLMVVSAAPGDGKTTVAQHLARAAARMGSRVLLVEADLRRPTLAGQLEIPSGPGLADVLIGAAAMGDAMQSVEMERPDGSDRGGGVRTFDVLVAGAVLPPNPAELIESQAMGALLEQARSAYDLVVIDTPPLTAVSDAFPLLRKVDGVIIVGRVGRNRRDVAERLHETLTGAGAPLLGVIANGLKMGRGGSYGYAYDYAYAPSERPSADAPSENGASAPSGVPTGRT
jgi:capsular exopolysaccharide synthesis family protein